MSSRKNPATGCRPDQLFGAWAIEPTRFRQMVDTAKGLDLAALNAEARAAAKADSMDLGAADPKPYEVRDGVAVISISGPMTKYYTSFDAMFGGCSTVMLRRIIREATDNDDVKSLLIEIDSPGGTVAGTSDLADDLNAFRAAGKTAYAYVSDLCASAAYWIASQCDRIYANSTAMVGSIGTYAVLEDTTGLQTQAGVKLRVVSTGKFKGLGADGAVTDDLVADVQREVNDLNELFLSGVTAGRAETLTPEQVRELADGRVHVGDKARQLGLVDEIASIDAAFQALAATPNTAPEPAQKANAMSSSAIAPRGVKRPTPPLRPTRPTSRRTRPPPPRPTPPAATTRPATTPATRTATTRVTARARPTWRRNPTATNPRPASRRASPTSRPHSPTIPTS